mmetsp:Transcript_32011/g.51030  ORF Transcript_32011/g.51030 Transcript_32011/m.51030 type:complete len:482 (-) Transcript_32011:22-1467(-)
MKTVFVLSFALFAASSGIASETTNVTSLGTPACKALQQKELENFPFPSLPHFDFEKYFTDIEHLNTMITMIEYGVAGTFMVAAAIPEVAVVATVFEAIAFFVGAVSHKSVDFTLLVKEFEHLIQEDDVRVKIINCQAKLRNFNVFLSDIYKCQVSEYQALEAQIGYLLSECDVDGLWGASGSRGNSMGDELTCVSNTDGLCYEATPLLHAAVMTSVYALDSLYYSAKVQTTRDNMEPFRRRLYNYAKKLRDSKRASLWAGMMNQKNVVHCVPHQQCQVPSITGKCLVWQAQILSESYYSWNWGVNKGWLECVDCYCKSDAIYNESSVRFNLAKVEHEVTSLFRLKLASDPSPCENPGWGDICQLQDGNWKKERCEDIRHHYFCEDKIGCKLEGNKCIVKAIDPPNLTMAECAVASKSTALSWDASSSKCVSGHGEGEFVSSSGLCASKLERCSKDWKSSGKKDTVCVKKGECVSKYHGKLA